MKQKAIRKYFSDLKFPIIYDEKVKIKFQVHIYFIWFFGKYY